MKRLVALAMVGLASLAKANLIVNGSFEFPDVTFPLVERSGTALTGWTIDGNIDHYGSDWVAQHGNQSVDMNGHSPGAIWQDIDTDSGQKYILTYWFAGNPEGFEDKTMDVWWNDTLVNAEYYHQEWQTKSSLGWSQATIYLTGTGSDRLRFESTTSFMDGVLGNQPYYGMALDNVSLIAIPEPGTGAVLASLGLLWLGRRRRS